MPNEHPTTVQRETLVNCIRTLGFEPSDVASVELRPTYVEVEVYEREPASGKVATLPGGYPALQTLTLAVVQ